MGPALAKTRHEMSCGKSRGLLQLKDGRVGNLKSPLDGLRRRLSKRMLRNVFTQRLRNGLLKRFIRSTS
jgi:hypothetical protein